MKHLQTVSSPQIFCIGCGYALRQITSTRCPECGRPFDPNDPRTMSLGSPLRRWQRWLLQPMGWRPVWLAMICAIGFAYLGGWPHLRPEPWSVIAKEFRWPHRWQYPFTFYDWVFFVSVIAGAAFVVWGSFRGLARFLVPKAARQASVPFLPSRRQKRLIAASVLTTLFFLFFGWQDRIGKRWIVRALKPRPTNQTQVYAWESWRYSPFELDEEESSLVLSNFVVDLPEDRERLAALGLLVESIGKSALPTLRYTALTEHDENNLAWEIRLIGLCRDPSTAALLERWLDDDRASIRAAAADALGILRKPSYSIRVRDGFYLASDELSLDSSPPINIGGIVSTRSSPHFRSFTGYEPHELQSERMIELNPAVQDQLLRMMVGGANEDEREAAARAIVAWPPKNYQLRIAEWGVWIQNNGTLGLAKSIIDEIPPFIHGTGDPTSSFDDYFLYPSMVTKPIIHLSANIPMAVDLEVQIHEGRPWFAFPQPDDFIIGQDPQSNAWLDYHQDFGRPSLPTTVPDDFKSPKITALQVRREGYPWLLPHHRLYGTDWQGGAAIPQLGLHWQSLIVCPDRPKWMAVPTVPADPKFRWWSTLRDVPCSWVDSRGEAERFLYYDGPTKAEVPIAAKLDSDDGSIYFQAPAGGITSQSGPPDSPAPQRHDGLYIEVRDGHLRAQRMMPPLSGSIAIQLPLPLEGEAVIATFRDMLTEYGLSGREADGLIRVWSPQFFQTEGRRFVLRMTKDEYNRQCPIKVQPAPTEMVRLGLVLTEFDAKPAPGDKPQ